MERLLFRRIELWIVGILIVGAALVAVAFGNVVFHTAMGGTRFGMVGDAAVAVANIPGLFKKMNPNHYLMVPDDKVMGTGGFAYSYTAGSRPDAGYLLLSRFDGDDERAYVELVDLNAQKVVHRWTPDTDAIHAKANLESNLFDLAKDRTQSRLLIRHPFVTADGGIIIKSHTPIYKVDACSKLVWMNDSEVFHHALERDGDGTFWVASKMEPVTIDHVDPKHFIDDGIAALDAGGKLLFERSVSGIMLKNGMGFVVYGGPDYENNPIHLNDIEPVLEDGPRWRKGDLFLSLRSPSMIVLYRPSEDKVLWYKIGPWLHQHDVDILDNHRISIYNNNGIEYFKRRGRIGNVEVMIYDFNTDVVGFTWKEALEKRNVRAETEGVQTILPNDELFIEEQNYGRDLRITKSGDIVWEFTNRAKSGHVFRLGWSRLLSPEYGKQVADTVAKANCEPSG